MSAPFVESLALTLVNNEALAEPVRISTTVGGVKTPMNLTGAQFQAQVRKKRGFTDVENPLVAQLQVVVTDALEGLVEFRYPASSADDLPPGRYVYDVLIKIDDGDPDNLWVSDFTVEKGVTQWLP